MIINYPSIEENIFEVTLENSFHITFVKNGFISGKLFKMGTNR